jgi:hypothetical protein
VVPFEIERFARLQRGGKAGRLGIRPNAHANEYRDGNRVSQGVVKAERTGDDRRPKDGEPNGVTIRLLHGVQYSARVWRSRYPRCYAGSMLNRSRKPTADWYDPKEQPERLSPFIDPETVKAILARRG